MLKKLIFAGSLLATLTVASQVSAAEYKVQPNDTLWKVSQKHHVSVSQIKEWNHLTSNVIRTNQVLIIGNDSSAKTSTTKMIKYTVKPKEYLSGLAKRYGTTVKEILKANPAIKNASLVKVGQVISIPTLSTTTTTTPVAPKPPTVSAVTQSNTKGINIHTIQPGDYLSVVAKKYGMSLNLLLAFNEQISNPSFIRVGDKIKIPNEDVIILSKIIHLEARGESYQGKVAVGNVIMNRVESNRFPDSVKAVVYQPNQFSPVKNGKMTSAVPTSESARAAVEAYNGANIISDALFFYSTKSTSSYLRSLDTVTTIGGHIFAK